MAEKLSRADQARKIAADLRSAEPGPDAGRCTHEGEPCAFAEQAPHGGSECRRCRHWQAPSFYLAR